MELVAGVLQQVRVVQILSMNDVHTMIEKWVQEKLLCNATSRRMGVLI